MTKSDYIKYGLLEINVWDRTITQEVYRFAAPCVPEIGSLIDIYGEENEIIDVKWYVYDNIASVTLFIESDED